MEPSRPLVIASLLAPPLVIAGGWVIFFVLKEPPPSTACFADPHPDVEVHRRGLGTYATASALVLGGLIGALSRRPANLYALGVAAWALVIENASTLAFVIHAAAAMAAGVLGGEVVWVVSGIAALTAAPRRGSLLVYLWTSLAIVLPVATGLVASHSFPLWCID